MLHKHIQNKQGFTLAELLTAVVIVSVLVLMATPMYEKLAERSHIAEARSILNTLQEAKFFAMEKMELDHYVDSPTPGDRKPRLEHLTIAFEGGSTGDSFETKYFKYSLRPTGTSTDPDGVCAVRLGGITSGTIFYYYHPNGSATTEFLCLGDHCDDVYGLDSVAAGSIVCN